MAITAKRGLRLKTRTWGSTALVEPRAVLVVTSVSDHTSDDMSLVPAGTLSDEIMGFLLLV